MSRWLDREEEKPESSSGPDTSLSRSGGGQERPRVAPSASVGDEFGENRRQRVVTLNREYWIRPSQEAALFDIGRFRAVNLADLKLGVFKGSQELATADLRSLIRQGLIRRVWILGKEKKPLEIASLTEAGVSVLKAMDPRMENDQQVVYAGFARVAELEHDSLLYRAFLKEIDRLREERCEVRKVVLDYELKSGLYSLQQKRRGEKPFREVREETAQELALPVINGHVTLPDFRIEYEDEEGTRSRVDIEVATGNYRQGHIAAKALAGFRIYAPAFRVVQGGNLKGNIFKDRASTVFSL